MTTATAATDSRVTRTQRKPRKMAGSKKALAAIREFDLDLDFMEGNMTKVVTIVDPDTTVVSLMAALRNREHGDLLSASHTEGKLYAERPCAKGRGRDRRVLIATWITNDEYGLWATDFTASYFSDDDGSCVELDL